jgi:hypothetical protein
MFCRWVARLPLLTISAMRSSDTSVAHGGCGFAGRFEALSATGGVPAPSSLTRLRLRLGPR